MVKAKSILEKIRHLTAERYILKVPLSNYLLSFFFIVVLRFFLETFSDTDSAGISFYYIFSYTLFCLSLALSFFILFYLLTKKNMQMTIRLVLLGFIVIIIPPIFDLLLSSGRGYNMSYIRPEFHSKPFLKFLTFYGPFEGVGITPGIKLEVVVVLSLCFLYFYLLQKKVVGALVKTLSVYILLFFYLSAPFWARGILNVFGQKYIYSAGLMNNFYLVLIIIQLSVVLVLSRTRLVISIMKDMRPFRLLHYLLMFLLGLALWVELSSYRLNLNDFFSLIFTAVCIIFAWLYSVMTNNIEDVEIDKISNLKRPLVSSEIKLKDYKNISLAFFIISIFYALMIDFSSLFIILVFIGNYYLYSMPPFRLKRIPILSKLIISFNSLALVMMGFMRFSSSSGIHFLAGFPNWITPVFLVGLTLCLNFIDIKDYHGDKAEGIKTLPVIFGLKKSKAIIGSFFFLTYISLYFVYREVKLLGPLILLGLVQFYFINRVDYEERPVFITYLLGLLTAVILLL